MREGARSGEQRGEIEEPRRQESMPQMLVYASYVSFFSFSLPMEVGERRLSAWGGCENETLDALASGAAQARQKRRLLEETLISFFYF